jgi:ubiquinone/menaquinone biosynthesis C-methylase UbiE
VNEQDAKFVGSIPKYYDEYLGPVVFAPHARELAARVARLLAAARLAPDAPQRVLEVACGTGVLTRALLAVVPPTCTIDATDLNGAMIDRAQQVGVAPAAAKRVAWRVAEAMELPFPPAGFDAVACQFGLMFVPDKARAVREAARVLRSGGAFHFDVWCGLEENPFARTARDVICGFFATNPPTFYDVPFGFHDERTIEAMLRDAGFEAIVLEKRSLDATARSASDLALGLVEGNPILNPIRDAGLATAPIIAALAKALAEVGGEAPFHSKCVALHGSARKK